MRAQHADGDGISSPSSGSAAVVNGVGGGGKVTGFPSRVLMPDPARFFQHRRRLSGSRLQPSPCVPSL